MLALPSHPRFARSLTRGKSRLDYNSHRYLPDLKEVVCFPTTSVRQSTPFSSTRTRASPGRWRCARSERRCLGRTAGCRRTRRTAAAAGPRARSSRCRGPALRLGSWVGRVGRGGYAPARGSRCPPPSGPSPAPTARRGRGWGSEGIAQSLSCPRSARASPPRIRRLDQGVADSPCRRSAGRSRRLRRTEVVPSRCWACRCCRRAGSLLPEGNPPRLENCLLGRASAWCTRQD